MKKSFRQYLMESKKEYKLRIKIAGVDEAPDMDKFETILDKYGLLSMSTFKRTPVEEHPQDFYTIQNSDVYITDVVFEYPVTANELYHYLQEETDLPGSHVVVINSDHPEEISREEKIQSKDEPYIPLLGSEYEQDEYEIEYGDEYNQNMLKDLETLNFEYAAGKPEKGKTTNDYPVNNEPVFKGRGKTEIGKK